MVATYQVSYFDSTLNFSIDPLNGITGQVVSSNAIHNDATQLIGGSLQQTGTTTYTPDGQTSTTTDQYGQSTTNTYDASGHLTQTLYPDGTAVRSTYDALGRVVWQTDRQPVATLNSGADATQTVYDSLGQVVTTNRASGVIITVKV